jgi:hypothetical protein
MAAQVKDAAWMRWMETLLGGASRQTCAATFPADRFYCLLDELPLHLIPRGAFGGQAGLSQEGSAGALILDSGCLIVPAGQLPNELISQRDLTAGFAWQGTIAWVKDFTGRSRTPFWLGPRLESAVPGLERGQDARELLSQADCRVLLAAGVLMRSDEPAMARRSREPLDSLLKMRKTYSEKGFAAFPGLLHPFHVAALRRYYRCLIRKGAIPLGDSQSPRRYVAYNEPVARFFHHQLTAVVSVIAGEPVKPSYAYLAAYLSGAELKKHTDREQCEFSVSLCLDFSPEPEGETPWPLCLDTREGEVKVHQALGDGLFYRGTRLPHYRDALAEGCSSTSIFFHYVSAGFTGSLG